jgi:hypothetical protein
MLSFLFFLTFQVILLVAWVTGYLDPYQKQLQELLLNYMGETKVSYGLKSIYIKEKKIRNILTLIYRKSNRQETHREPEFKQDSRSTRGPTG